MSPRRTAAIFGHNLKLLLADPAPMVVTTLMPLVLMAFLQGTGRAVLEAEGYAGVTGAEQVVPGMAVLFAFFGVTYLGMGFFAEHGWGTWERLRSSPARLFEILVGKLLPSGLVILAQVAVLFGAGALLFGLRITGSITALVIMMLASTIFLLALSMLCVSIFRTINQLSAAANVGAMVVAGLGGALAPLSVMPTWAREIAPISPAYWSLQGFRAVVLEGGGFPEIANAVLILAGTSIACGIIAALRFRPTDAKVWAA
jgi:ABC-2 type transport system permease protein